MAALVQTYSQQSGTVTLLQTKTGSATGTMAGTSQGHSGQMYGNPQRSAYHSSGTVGSQSGYRSGSAAPIQPYAFTSTPGLSGSGQSSQGGGYRTSSGTTVPTLPQLADARTQSSSTTIRPHLNGTSNQPTFAQVAASKASPERYRRPAAKQSESSPSVPQTQTQPQHMQAATTQASTGTATSVQFYNPRTLSRNPGTTTPRPQSAHGALASATMDDMQLYRNTGDEESKRYRRRSIHSINSADFVTTPPPQSIKRTPESSQADGLASSRKQGTEKEQRPTRVVPLPPPVVNASLHVRNGSSESVVSSRSSSSRPSSVSKCLGFPIP